MEDYGVIYLGSAIFKIARLLFIALFSVHFFACIFFRVKIASANTPEDVTVFYTSRNVASNVSKSRSLFSMLKSFVLMGDNVVTLQDLGQQYVSALYIYTRLFAVLFHLFGLFFSSFQTQMVCFYYVLTTFTTVGYGKQFCCFRHKDASLI